MGWTSVENDRHSSKLEKLKGASAYYEGNTWLRTDGTQELHIEMLREGPGGVYGVLRRTNLETGGIVRLALVILTKTTGKDFRWKGILETDGPVEFRYPKQLLSKLSPPEAFAVGQELEHAKGWRRKVQEYRSTQAPENRIKTGDIIEFKEDVPFTINKKEILVRRFEVLEWGARKRLTAIPPSPATCFPCRLHAGIWHHRDYTVTREGQAFQVVSHAR